MENNSGDENSDGGLRIVIDSPRPKKRARKELDDTDKKIIESVEKDIEDNLEEKAAKANLTAKHVKNIIKEVVTNEHVMALVRHAENPDDHHESLPTYEPKYTRAKTKELLSTSTPQKILPWMSPPRLVSEVQMLFNEDLQEDSSGDEYLPDTPSKNSSFDTQLDVSACSTKGEEANIALRTRSKLSLSQTPLEVIEESFMPPDITTDMYDMDCDDDEWKEFLKTFTRPLDEVTKAAEDEDHDPEYNVLADEEIDEIDKEELRADRAVTVSRKEFNCLMAELFEFADIYESNKSTDKNANNNNITLELEKTNNNDPTSDLEDDPNISIKKCQIPILAQQMRQHVQMLTQNFLLSYGHPEFGCHAEQYKEMLNDIVTGIEGKDASIYCAINLESSTKLIEHWEGLYSSRDKEVIECKKYVEKVLVESKEAKLAGREYIVTFPELLMKTIVNSEAFIYPNLLPRIPFRSFHVTTSVKKVYTNGEDNLIALFLEQVIPVAKHDPHYITSNKKLNMLKICDLFTKLVMQDMTASKVKKRIIRRRDPRSEDNPIKFYFRTKKAPPTVHYVVPMEAKDVLPPCERNPDSLPHQWREYVNSTKKNETDCAPVNNNTSPVIVVSYPIQLVPVFSSSVSSTPTPNDINLSRRFVGNRRIQPKTLLPEPAAPRVAPRRKQRNCGKRKVCNSSDNVKVVPVQKRQVQNKVCDSSGSIEVILIEKEQEQSEGCDSSENIEIILIQKEQEQSQVCDSSEIVEVVLIQKDPEEEHDMLPDMPSLGGTPEKNDNANAEEKEVKETDEKVDDGKEQNLSFRNITAQSLGFQFSKPNAVDQVKRNFESISEFSSAAGKEGDNSAAEKDNPADIHELMIASSTVESVKKGPSGAEKKRAKIRREFVTNLVMATPEDVGTKNQKEDNFVGAFAEKLRLSLTVEDYDKIMDVLGHYDQTNGDFLELFKSVQSILFPTYQEVYDEFFLFLTDIQAHKVGKLMPYIVMKDMSRFVRKLHVYFKDQPSQMKKILKCLTDLAENPDVSIDNIKTTVLPLLKGNAALTDWFLQVFPHERPPKLITTGPHDIIDLSKELGKQPGEDICETVIFPDTEDPYGGSGCICTCHNVEDPQYKARSRHCKNCGLKFMQGKVFIQTGKSLRPAVVSFITNPEKDHAKRLVATRKRLDSSPTKPGVSPNKESEEIRQSHESEEDENKKNKKQSKTQPRQRKVKPPVASKVKKTVRANSKGNQSKAKCKITKSSPKRQSKKPATKKTPQHKPGSTPGQQKRPATEEPEVECPEPGRKVNSEQSAESASELFESAQDGAEEQGEASWSREEDKIILQAFRQSSGNEDVFQSLAETLENRSVLEIKNRFHKLLSLLQQMASK